MSLIAAFIGVVVFVSFIHVIDKKNTRLSEKDNEISKLESNINSKEFTIICQATQLLCMDMLVDLHKIKLDKQSEGK